MSLRPAMESSEAVRSAPGGCWAGKESVMGSATRGGSDDGFSRREVIALAGVAGALTSASAASSDALARGRSVPRAGATSVGSGMHPLDPLTAGEVRRTFALIEADARFPSGGVFPIVQLREPPKGEVLSWRPGHRFRRE